MTLGRRTRLGAAVALALAGTTGGTLGLAAPAHAAGLLPDTISCLHVHILSYYPNSNPPSISGQNYLFCDINGSYSREYLTMTIYKYESGSWVQVATSTGGHATYFCNGNTENKFEDQSGDEISAPCV